MKIPDEKNQFNVELIILTLTTWIHFFWVTNAPGCSAFNRVERRMAPLSK